MADPIKPPEFTQPTARNKRKGKGMQIEEKATYDVAYGKHRKRELERLRKLRQKSREDGDKALFDIVSVLSAAMDGRSLFVGPDGNWHEKPLAEQWTQPEAADTMSSKEQRDELNRRMISDFRKSWAVHGADAVEQIAKEKPADYLKLIASVMPKEVEQTLEHRYVVEVPSEISAGDWSDRYSISEAKTQLIEQTTKTVDTTYKDEDEILVDTTYKEEN